ncbi:GAF domain-containing sensor histidine kinase [Crocosphaera sp.]|uniref:GAF domain-containing sensor histidine kinase n=1 Tax=Crocosphaera sp. TaxID=2729996 RepID=UPI002632B3D7|nr:GAF domain-containing sensor histidine kinase [Crocosphaera sp.]MDJ0580662.1 GAF domain-containing sensor histidine kinase [Crocosphaera sp.]
MNTEELRQELKNLNDISKNLTHCQSIDEVVRMALAEVRKQLNVQVASLFLFSKDGIIKRIGIDGIDKDGNKIDNSWFPDEQYLPGESFSGKAIPPYDAEYGHGDPQYSNNLEKEYSMVNGDLYKEKLGELKCGISVPLNGSYRTFGTLTVFNKRKSKRFKREDVYWLMMIGRVVADFISLFKQKQSLGIDKRLIKKLVELERSQRNFNLQEVYDLVGKSLTADFLPYQVCIIRIPDDNNDLYLKIGSSTHNISWEGRKDGSVKAGSKIVGQVYESQKPIYIEDINEFEIKRFNNQEWIKNNHLKSIACLPLYVQDECVGTISVYTQYKHKFYQDHKNFLEQIAFLTAAIISRVKIIHILKKINEMLNNQRNISLLISIDNLSHRILHQYKTELINFYQVCQKLVHNGNLSNRNRDLIEKQMQFINRRIKEVINDLKTDEPISVNVNVAIKEVIQNFWFDLSNLDIEVNLKSDDTIPVIAIDERKIKHIIFNLLTNAEKAIHKAAPKKGEISIETCIDRSQTIEYILITIEDNGIGISNDIGERVYEKGFTTKKSEGGTGLGLYVVRQILNQYGGKIYFNSTIGKGSKFYVKIPLRRYITTKS